MVEQITPEIRSKLGEIGFSNEEISAIELLHELKAGKYAIDIKEILNMAISEKATETILHKLDELSWNMGEKYYNNREDLYDR